MRNRRITVFTSTRAEYGLLYWLMKGLQENKKITLTTLVSGSHLSPEFGQTVASIEKDSLPITERVEMLLSSDSATGVVKSFGLGMIGYSDALNRLNPDLLIVLGDRYEALAVAQTAFMLRVPVCHIHGGELTEGAYDDAFRHSITKFSSYHFTSCEEYRNRVIQLGEHPSTVINVGAIGLDHIKKMQLMNTEELSKELNFNLDRPYFLVTFHPETLSSENGGDAFKELLLALDNFQDHKVIFTYPNADDGGRESIALIEKYVQKDNERCKAFSSLGQKRYLSAVKHSSAVIGNSSSGIIEVPSLGIPTVNIGDRQKGRIASESVFNSQIQQLDIIKTIKTAIKVKKSGRLKYINNPYGNGGVSEKIIKHLLNIEQYARIKQFYDLKE